MYCKGDVPKSNTVCALLIMIHIVYEKWMQRGKDANNTHLSTLTPSF